MPRRRTPLILTLLLLLALLSAFAGVLAGLIKLPQPVTSNPLLALLLVVLVLAGLGWWLWRLQSAPESSQPPPAALALQNRQRMLERVRAIWIDGVLKESVHHAVLLALGLQAQPQAVENPWRLTMQDIDHPPRDLPAGTSITQVYDSAGGKLLILGAPGSGKTTLLLELARDLLARAAQDDQRPMPVIFSLSSWASQQPNLADWFVDELRLKYYVPAKLGRAWVESEQLLPLLDGLDEVPQDRRAACVEAINAYQQQQGHGLAPLVLTSREAEYTALNLRVVLQSAVLVQPLTPPQVGAYLSSARGQLEGVRAALAQDTDLRALATTPLMLSILSLAYQGQPAQDLLATPPAERQRHLFATYVQRALARRKPSTDYPPEQTIRGLAWLARQMTQHNLTTFHLERMQPDWLPDARSRRRYQRLVSLVMGLIFGLGAGQFAGLLFGLLIGPLAGQFVGLIFGLGSALGLGLLGGLSSNTAKIVPVEVLSWKWERFWRRHTRFDAVIVLVGGLIGGLAAGLLLGLAAGLRDGLLFVLSFGLVSELLRLYAGWSSDLLNTSKLLKPNQGIWDSARHSIRTGLVSWLVVWLGIGLSIGLVGWLGIGLSVRPPGWLFFGLFFGLGISLFFGLGIGLRNGGRACIQHVFLRLMLRRAGCTPRGYVAFLDYAAACILLRKVGGGYTFIHRLLLDYFASLDAPAPPPKA